MPALTACARQVRPVDECFERDHRAAMDVEGIEPGTEVARDVGEAWCDPAA